MPMNTTQSYQGTSVQRLPCWPSILSQWQLQGLLPGSASLAETNPHWRPHCMLQGLSNEPTYPFFSLLCRKYFISSLKHHFSIFNHPFSLRSFLHKKKSGKHFSLTNFPGCSAIPTSTGVNTKFWEKEQQLLERDWLHLKCLHRFY
uniref:Uncharacterized protein n=1 Tax=Malurus cyaneus samueli TaxID=2593467 RepID=A0A8C5X599_9PASS